MAKTLTVSKNVARFLGDVEEGESFRLGRKTDFEKVLADAADAGFVLSLPENGLVTLVKAFPADYPLTMRGVVNAFLNGVHYDGVRERRQRAA